MGQTIIYTVRHTMIQRLYIKVMHTLMRWLVLLTPAICDIKENAQGKLTTIITIICVFQYQPTSKLKMTISCIQFHSALMTSSEFVDCHFHLVIPILLIIRLKSCDIR